MARETEFLLSQLRDDDDPIDLWPAPYTFLRAGLPGQSSVLMVTSRHQHGVDAADTTPATRATWVRLHFYGAPLPNGFPGALRTTPARWSTLVAAIVRVSSL